jgi:hypothetical protein
MRFRKKTSRLLGALTFGPHAAYIGGETGAK